MNKQINILMLGGAKRVSLASHIKATALKSGLDVHIYSYEIEETVPIAKVGTVIKGLRWKDPKLYNDLLSIIRENDIQIVLPFVDGAIEVSAQLKIMRPDLFIPVCEYKLCRAMFDKRVAAILFEEQGWSIPTTYTPSDCSFPAIAKPRLGSASKGIKVVRNEAELRAIENIDDYLLQEYIEERDEYTVDSYVSVISGTVKCVVPRIRLSVAGGEVDRTETHRIPQLIKMSNHILAKLRFFGPITLQFIYDKVYDRYLLMEINPRLGGGVICSILAGADIPSMILEEALGTEATECTDWRDRALMTRYFEEVMFFNDKE